jgi:hypothetical protein
VTGHATDGVHPGETMTKKKLKWLSEFIAGQLLGRKSKEERGMTTAGRDQYLPLPRLTVVAVVGWSASTIYS